MKSKISKPAVAMLFLAVAGCNAGLSSSARPSVLAANTATADSQPPSAPVAAAAPAAGTPGAASPGSPAAPAATGAPSSQDSPSGASTTAGTATAAPATPASGAALSLTGPLEIIGGGGNNLSGHSVISLSFKDAAGAEHLLYIDVFTRGIVVEQAVDKGFAKVLTLEVDKQPYSDLPTWRQLARQLKTAKGRTTGRVYDAITKILSCVRKDEDGAPDCSAPNP
jgi:hypothetical protein